MNDTSITNPEEDSIEAFARAIETRTAAEGELNLEMGRLHRQLSGMYEARRDFESAAKSMSKAMDIFEAVQAFGGEVDAEEKAALYKALPKLLLKADDVRHGVEPQ